MKNSKAISKLRDDGNTCLRLRGAEGHYLTLLPCGINEKGEVTTVDLCKPDGTVLYCGVDNEVVDILIDYLGVEPIES